jgi:hypothetical protein
VRRVRHPRPQALQPRHHQHQRAPQRLLLNMKMGCLIMVIRIDDIIERSSKQAGYHRR